MATASLMFDLPLALATKSVQPNSCNRRAYPLANLPSCVSTSEISGAFRFRFSLGFGPVAGCISVMSRMPCAHQGGAALSQADSVCTSAVDTMLAWPNRQALVPPPAGATKCARTNVRNRVRLLGEAKGTCAARQRKFRKQPPRVHHAMQNSLPASFVGGRCLRRMLRVPPGRNVISLKSAYVCGFVMRATSHSARHLARQCRHRCFCHRRRASRKGRAACVSTGRSVGARCWPRLHVRWRNRQPAVRGILKRA